MIRRGCWIALVLSKYWNGLTEQADISEITLTSTREGVRRRQTFIECMELFIPSRRNSHCNPGSDATNKWVLLIIKGSCRTFFGLLTRLTRLLAICHLAAFDGKFDVCCALL